MTPAQAGAGVIVGFVTGILSGSFGVGGGILTTPAVNSLLGGTAIQAIATPLPVILPTALAGAYTYAKSREISLRAARWAAPPGIVCAVLGAYLTEIVNAHLLLLATAGLIALTSIQVMRRGPAAAGQSERTSRWTYGVIGSAAGSSRDCWASEAAS